MIGVAITVHNRNETAYQTIAEWQKYMPENSRLLVVDDSSDEPIKGADFRFQYNVGIAQAKNKCLELLQDCDYIFLADDDVFPTKEDWYKAYIDSGEHHLCMTFDRLKDGRRNGNNLIGHNKNGLPYFFKPCGCLLFLTKHCLNKIGGFDERFVKWGYEHVEYSNRAFNAGLCSNRFLDVKDSLDYFRSLDHESSVITSTKNRSLYIELNKKRIQLFDKFSGYRPFKREVSQSYENVVLTAYLNSIPDPQRRLVWSKESEGLQLLIDSVASKKIHIVVLHDCLELEDTEYCHFVKVDRWRGYPPNVYRYFLYENYLKSNVSKRIWLVDSTDVEMLKNPFNQLEESKIFVGCEHKSLVNNIWMKRTQIPHVRHIPDYTKVINENAYHMLLNCGLTGGYYGQIMKYLQLRTAIHENYTFGNLHSTDMAIFNYIMFKFFKGSFVFAGKINTIFKKYENNLLHWWRHK